LYADLSYNFQGEGGKGTFNVESEAGSLNCKFEPTGRYVGEPNSNWQIDSYDSHRLGQRVFAKPGYYNISLEINPGKDEEIGFQWLWLGTE
jgi:alpha-L-fucosidase